MDWYLENCTNKNKPELHCNGKCQLNQEETRNPNFTWLKIASEFIGLPALEASVSIHKISTVFQQVSHKIQNPLFGFLRLNLRPQYYKFNFSEKYKHVQTVQCLFQSDYSNNQTISSLNLL